MTTNQTNRHTITALVQDRPGVLNRLSSMFRRRGFNISSLAVGKSEDESLSRMTFVVDGNDKVVEQVTKHLNKLIDVIKVSDISQENIVSRELALIRVKTNIGNRSEVMQIASTFRTNIVDISLDSLIIEVSGNEEKINSLHEVLKGFGVIEIMRTGTIALNRGIQPNKPIVSHHTKYKHESWEEASSV